MIRLAKRRTKKLVRGKLCELNSKAGVGWQVVEVQAQRASRSISATVLVGPLGGRPSTEYPLMRRTLVHGWLISC